jgi:hypothetical protein
MVGEPPGPSIDGPARRRSSWNFKAIVEDVAGVPLADLQDPERPVHPYVQARLERAAAVGRSAAMATEETPYDPVGRIYPPLSGATGRGLHGAEHEHDAETLARHASSEGEPGHNGGAHRPSGPSHRPERLYLHYLLLHLDRLNDSALSYLKHAVDEEIAHRETPPVLPDS